MKSVNILFESYTKKRFMRVIEYGNRVFKIKCEHNSGDPIGFNHYCCLSIMNRDGYWSNVVDNKEIGFVFNRRPNLDENHSSIDMENMMAYKEFVEYIKKVYRDD